MVGATLFGKSAAGYLLYGAHILSSLTVGLIFRFYRRKEDLCIAPSSIEKSVAKPVSSVFTQSVKASAQSVVNICAYVIFFSVGIKLLYLSGFIPFGAKLLVAILKPLDLSPAFTEKLIGGFFELTTGVYGVASSGGSLNARLSATAFILGWAGLSVHFQVLDFMSDSGLSPRPYIAGKLLHGIFSGVFTYIGAFFIPFDLQTVNTVSGHISALGSTSPSVIFPLSVVSAAAVWSFLWLLSRFYKEKIERRRKR
jgi:hypothetical protein